MQDLEYVTRFIAFTELDYENVYKDNINSFLNKALKTVNTYPEAELDRVRKNFIRTMEWSFLLFGKYAFRRYNATWRRGPINKAMFELWSICLKDMHESDIKTLLRDQKKFLSAFRDLQQTTDLKAAFDSNKSTALKKRVQLTKSFLEEMLCCKPSD